MSFFKNIKLEDQLLLTSLYKKLYLVNICPTFLAHPKFREIVRREKKPYRVDQYSKLHI